MTPVLRESSLEAAAPPRTQRLVGVDLARAIAFGGMLLAHFAAAMHADDPGWLRALDQAADGRAAPLFCVLLGLGAGLLATRGTPDRVFLRRGLVLFAVGFAIWPFVDWVYLILPQYGVLLAAFPLLRRLPTRWLLPAAFGAFLLPSLVVTLAGEYGLRSAGLPDTYAELLNLPRLAATLTWTGAYPVIGWVGFVLVGMWLARLSLDDARVQWRLLAGGVAVALTQPVVALANSSNFLDGSAHSNQTAWYILASATAVATVALCLLVTRSRLRAKPLVLLGQLALSAYLGHILLGEFVLWEWLRETRPPLTVQVLLVVTVFGAFACAASAWRARYRRGPVESVVRALSG